MDADLLKICKVYKRFKELKLGRHEITAGFIEKKEKVKKNE